MRLVRGLHFLMRSFTRSSRQSCKSFSRTRPRDRSIQSPDHGQVIVQIILHSAMQPFTHTKPCESVSQHGHANRGLWARPPVLSPVPVQAVHSHEESDNTSVVQTLALRKDSATNKAIWHSTSASQTTELLEITIDLKSSAKVPIILW